MERPRSLSPPLDPLLSDVLHCSRWIAAMMVMAGHLRDILFSSYDKVVNPGILTKCFYFLTGFNHYAVIIFFVLSGFLVGGGVLEEWRWGGFSWKNYLIKRTTRIYIVFVVALHIGGALDLSGLLFFNQLGMYDNTDMFRFNSALTDWNIQQHLSFPILLGNIAMLQTILVPILGSNGPLWSLANEFWYYFLFPAIVGTFAFRSLSGKAISLAVATAIFLLLPFSILLYFSLWILGALVRRFYWKFCPGTLLSLVLFCTALIMVRSFGRDSFWNDTLVAVTFSSLLHALHRRKELRVTPNGLPGHDLHQFLAGFSYSLYVLHFPLILFLVNVLNRFTGLRLEGQPRGASLFLFVLLAIIVYYCAYLFSRVTEQKTKLVRRYFFNLADSLRYKFFLTK